MFPIRLARVLLLGALAAAALPVAAFADDAGAPWGPFIQDNKGGKKAMPADPLHNKDMSDKEWRLVAYTEYSGYKPRMAVELASERVVNAPQYNNEFVRLLANIYGRSGSVAQPLDKIPEMLSEALVATNRFDMLERGTALEDVTNEQDFGGSGRVDRSTAARSGRIKGAAYVVKTTLIDLDPEKESSKIGMVGGGVGQRTLGIGSLGLSGKVAFCRINVRVINSETSSQILNVTVDGTAKSSGIDVGAGLMRFGTRGMGGGGIGVSNQKRAPLSDAIEACMNKAAFVIASKLQEMPRECKVASVSAAGITIIGGQNLGVKVGDEGVYLVRGEDVVDPDTQEVIEHSMTEVGRVRVIAVQERSAKCEPLTTINGAKAGDFVRFGRQN